jgi:hypothetical protein
MADTLVERITGQATADAVPVEVGLVMTDRTLVGDDNTPAHLDGYGPIPAFLSRRLVRDADKAWIRRLYTHPTTGELVAIDSRRRCFEGPRRQLLIWRDQTCRTPWCEAPIRHGDHIVSAADGGETSADNGQGLCEACNYTKETPGWSARRLPGARHPIQTTTPTGHRHLSHAPDPPGQRRPTYRLDIVVPTAA